MPPFFQNLEWKPSTVSWFSFVLMGLIVAGIGLSGTAYVVSLLQVRLMHHGIEHSREVSEALLSEFDASSDTPFATSRESLVVMIEKSTRLGYRVLIVDLNASALVADSGANDNSPVPLADSWIAQAIQLGSDERVFPPRAGAVRAYDDKQHPMLILFQEIPGLQAGRWLLGVAKDQKTLTEFLGDLHWHIDTVMLLTYVLITVLGYYAMRSIGRAYEHRLESQVKQRTAELEVAHADSLSKTRLAVIGKTASVLAHEMRNPLASLKFALSSIKDSPNLEEREHRRIDLVLGEVDRLDALLSETLDYVRPIRLSIEPVVLDELLNRVLKQQEPLIAEKDLHLSRKLCEGCSATRLDEAQMHQVILNLVKNAVEASPAGSVIDVSLQQEHGQLRLDIANEGNPLDGEILKRAFEPFYTTKSTGTGLGLGLVKRVVEEHGGSVELNSLDSTTARVTVLLPIAPSLSISCG